MSDELEYVGARVSPAMAEALRERARRDDRSAASVIREALRERLAPVESDAEHGRASWSGDARA